MSISIISPFYPSFKSVLFISPKNCDKSKSEKKELLGLTTVVFAVIAVLAILVLILLCIVIGICLKKNKALSMQETVEENHYYDESVVYNIEKSKVVDNNDYYDK